jgi:hypothetical protein
MGERVLVILVLDRMVAEEVCLRSELYERRR